MVYLFKNNFNKLQNKAFFEKLIVRQWTLTGASNSKIKNKILSLYSHAIYILNSCTGVVVVDVVVDANFVNTVSIFVKIASILCSIFIILALIECKSISPAPAFDVQLSFRSSTALAYFTIFDSMREHRFPTQQPNVRISHSRSRHLLRPVVFAMSAAFAPVPLSTS